MSVMAEAMDIVIATLVRHIADDPKGAASVIEAALQKARDDERATVVAWLRNDASAAWGEACDGMEEMSWCIEAIERGEHRREA